MMMDLLYNTFNYIILFIVNTSTPHMAPKKKRDPNFLSNIKKGTMHRALGYKPDEKIPVGVVNKIVSSEVGDKISVNGEKITVTQTLRKKAQFAKNTSKWKK